MKTPTPVHIANRRAQTKLSSKQAGGLVGVCKCVWQQWERGEQFMSPALWELFCLKTQSKVPKDQPDDGNPQGRALMKQYL